METRPKIKYIRVAMKSAKDEMRCDLGWAIFVSHNLEKWIPAATTTSSLSQIFMIPQKAQKKA